MASKSLVHWLKTLWENWRASAWCDLSRVVFCWVLLSCVRVVSPVSLAARGFVLLL
jgi:hypothetical protein